MNIRMYQAGEAPDTAWEAFALRFVEALVARQHEAAYAMTAAGFREAHTCDWLRERAEWMLDQSTEAFGPCHLYTSNPTRHPGDLGWAYVTIGGEFNEAISAIIVLEGDQYRVRDLAIGRP